MGVSPSSKDNNWASETLELPPRGSSSLSAGLAPGPRRSFGSPATPVPTGSAPETASDQKCTLTAARLGLGSGGDVDLSRFDGSPRVDAPTRKPAGRHVSTPGEGVALRRQARDVPRPDPRVSYGDTNRNSTCPSRTR